MSDTSDDPRETSLANLWRWHAFRCLRDRPRPAKRAMPAGFSGFLLLLGSTCDPDGANKRPPSRDSIASFLGVSQASIRGYWNAASSLGLVDVQYAGGEGRVQGYTILMRPTSHLDWDAFYETFASDRRRILIAQERAEEKKKREQKKARQAIEDARSGSREPSSATNDSLSGSREPLKGTSDWPTSANKALTAHVSRSENALGVSREPLTNGPGIDLNGSREPQRTAHRETGAAHVSRRPGPTKTNHDSADAVDQPAAPPREDLRTWATRTVAELGPLWSEDDYADDEGGPGDWESDAWMGSPIEPSGDVSVV